MENINPAVSNEPFTGFNGGGSPHEEHWTIMDAKVNDLWTTSMHSVCMVRPSP